MNFDRFEEIVEHTLRQNSDTHSSHKDSDMLDNAHHQDHVHTQLSMRQRMLRSNVSWMDKKGCRFSKYDRPGHPETHLAGFFDTLDCEDRTREI
jgi:hypothetical protein